MKITRIIWLELVILVCGVLALALAGCQDGPGFRQVPLQFAGPYVGSMAPPDLLTAVRQDTIGTEAAIEATINTDGSVVFNITSIEGVFIATGGITADNRLSATGPLNGDTVVFTGTWATNGYGHAAGTWRNLQTGITSFWQIAQQGVANSSFITAYAGQFTEGTISSTLEFTIAADGSITGIANGFGVSEAVSLTGGINLENLIVMTGDYEGEPVLFIGNLDTASRSVMLGFAASGVNGGIIGSWTAAVAP